MNNKLYIIQTHKKNNYKIDYPSYKNKDKNLLILINYKTEFFNKDKLYLKLKNKKKIEKKNSGRSKENENCKKQLLKRLSWREFKNRELCLMN